MSLSSSHRKDPAKRAAKRAAIREAKAAGRYVPPMRRQPTAQMSHASSAKANRRRREGEKKMEAEYRAEVLR